MEMIRTGFRLHLDRAGAVLAVLRAVVGGQYFDFGNGIDAGINIQRRVASVIESVTAVNFKVVVFGAAAVDAKSHRRSPRLALISARLIRNAWRQGDQLRKVATV